MHSHITIHSLLHVVRNGLSLENLLSTEPADCCQSFDLIYTLVTANLHINLSRVLLLYDL